MTIPSARIPARTVALCAASAVLLLTGCVEPRAPRSAAAPATIVGDEIGVQLSILGSAAAPGDSVIAVARVLGATSVPAVASFTARLAYDTSALTFLGERSANDGAARAVNALPAVIREAGIALGGFRDGQLFAVVFRVRDPAALGSLVVHLDEMHGTHRENLMPRLKVLPPALTGTESMSKR